MAAILIPPIIEHELPVHAANRIDELMIHGHTDDCNPIQVRRKLIMAA